MNCSVARNSTNCSQEHLTEYRSWFHDYPSLNKLNRTIFL